jgi:hypothetical protein
MEKEMSLMKIMNNGKALEIKRAMSVKMYLKGYLEKEVVSLLEVSVQFVRKGWSSTPVVERDLFSRRSEGGFY